VRVQDSENRGQNVGQEKENKEKEGHQETVNTPLTSPTDDLPLVDSVNNNVQVMIFDVLVKEVRLRQVELM